MGDDFSGKGVEVNSAWMKFTTVGDWIGGTLVKSFHQEANQVGFQDQTVYVLTDCTINGEKQAKEVQWNVARPVTHTGFHSRMAQMKQGAKVKILFEKELPAQKKGFNPGKAITIEYFGMNPEFAPQKDFGEDFGAKSSAENSSTKAPKTFTEDIPF